MFVYMPQPLFNKDYFLQKDYNDLVDTLADAAADNSTKHDIDKLLKETFTNRRLELAKMDGRPLHKLCNKFPALLEAKYVSLSQRRTSINKIDGNRIV